MKKALPTHTSLNSFIIQPESYGATVDEGFIVGGPVGDFELLLCHGTVCVVGKMRDLILQLSKSSIYSTKSISDAETSITFVPFEYFLFSLKNELVWVK